MEEQQSLNDSIIHDVSMVDGTLQSSHRKDNKWKSIWCEDCGIYNIGECLIHGGNLIAAHDNVLPSRACLTLPKFLNLKTVKGRRGVYAKKAIRQRTLFGPLEAVEVTTRPFISPGCMEYQLVDEEGSVTYFDISDESKCNWMIFVHCASSFYDQNVAAFQKNGQIFFATGKRIAAGSELRVWYVPGYAKRLGKPIFTPETDFKPDIDQSKASQKEDRVRKAKSSPKSWKKKRKGLGDDCIGNKKGPTSSKVWTRSPQRQDFGSQNLVTAFDCSLCGSVFARPSQLVSHKCKEIAQQDSFVTESAVRRRKGRPRKALLEDGSSSNAVVENSGEISGSVNSSKRQAHKKLKETASQNGSVPAETGIHTSSSNVTDSNESQVITLPKSENYEIDDDHDLHPREDTTDANETLQMISDTNGPSPIPDSFWSPNSCKMCSKTFSSSDMLHAHELTHTEADSYTCEVEGCGKIFTSKFKYLRHATVHFDPHHYKCNFCQSTFNRSDHLKNHLLIHDSNRETFTCDICGKSYLLKSTLLFHKAKHEANEGQSLKCLVCTKEFKTKQELKKHVNSHNRYKRDAAKSRLHQCPQCVKTFVSLKDVRRHLVTHTKERPFLCEHCPQTFVRKDHLRRHYTTHHKVEIYENQLKINPFGCSACLKVFKRQEYLDYHMRDLHSHGIQEPQMYTTKLSKERKIHANTIQQITPKTKKISEAVKNEVLHIYLDNRKTRSLEAPLTEVFSQTKAQPDAPKQKTMCQPSQELSLQNQLIHPENQLQHQQAATVASVDMLQVQHLSQALGLQPVQGSRLTTPNTVVHSSDSLPLQTPSTSRGVISLKQTQIKSLPISVQHLIKKPLKQRKQQHHQQLQLDGQDSQGQQPPGLSQQQQQQHHLTRHQVTAKESHTAVQAHQLESLQQHLLLQQQIQQQLQQQQQQQQQQNQQHMQVTQNFKEDGGQPLDNITSTQELLLTSNSNVLNLVSSFDPSKSLEWSVIDDLNKTDNSKSSNTVVKESSSSSLVVSAPSGGKADHCYVNSVTTQIPSNLTSDPASSTVLPVSNPEGLKAFVSDGQVKNLTEEECLSILNTLRGILSQQQQLQQPQSGKEQQLLQHQSNDLGVQQDASNFSLGWPTGLTEYPTNLSETSLQSENAVANQNVGAPANWIIQLPVVLDQTQISPQLGIQQQLMQQQQQQQSNTQVISQQHQGQVAVVQQQHSQTQLLQQQQQQQILQQHQPTQQP